MQPHRRILQQGLMGLVNGHAYAGFILLQTLFTARCAGHSGVHPHNADRLEWAHAWLPASLLFLSRSPCACLQLPAGGERHSSCLCRLRTFQLRVSSEAQPPALVAAAAGGHNEQAAAVSGHRLLRWRWRR